MKRLAFALGVLALAFVASTPARADFAVVKFNDGWCRVWTDTAFGPQRGHFLWFRHWGHWRHHWHWSYHTATWEKSSWRLHRAIAHGRCHG